jgi:hypothetical protein
VLTNCVVQLLQLSKSTNGVHMHQKARHFHPLLYLVLLVATPVLAQQAEPSNPSDALVKWDTKCDPHGCMLMTDVLRGYSGDPANPKDSREYISIVVAIDRATLKPAYFSFHVDPRVQVKDGVFIVFAKTVPDGNSWRMELDPQGPSRLPFESCDKDSCVTHSWRQSRGWTRPPRYGFACEIS